MSEDELRLRLRRIEIFAGCTLLLVGAASIGFGVPIIRDGIVENFGLSKDVADWAAIAAMFLVISTAAYWAIKQSR
jgi:hypothetical protein